MGCLSVCSHPFFSRISFLGLPQDPILAFIHQGHDAVDSGAADKEIKADPTSSDDTAEIQDRVTESAQQIPFIARLCAPGKSCTYVSSFRMEVQQSTGNEKASQAEMHFAFEVS